MRFWVTLLTDRQTDKQTWANAFTFSVVGGNNACFVMSFVLCLMYMYENVLALICYCGQFLGFKAAGLQFSVSEKMLFGAVSRRVTVVWKLSDVATELCCCSWEDLAVIKCDLAMSMIVHCVLMLNSDVFCVLTRAIEHTSHLCQWNWLIVIHNPPYLRLATSDISCWSGGRGI